MASYHKRDVNFVAPAPKARVEIIESPPAQLPAPPQTILMPHAGYEDRARGFGLSTAPLAALLLALAGFTAAWLVAYVAHTLISPDGALFLHTIFAWRFLRAEQRERHRRYSSVRTEKVDRYE